MLANPFPLPHVHTVSAAILPPTRSAKPLPLLLALLRLIIALTAALAFTSVVLVTAQHASAAAPCSPVELVAARGTEEPGDLGDEVGDPLYGALQDALPVSVSAYRVDYPATLEVHSPGLGSADLVQHLVDQAAACPDQRFIVAGYSQGALVVHTALGTSLADMVPGAAHLPPELNDRIAAVLLFGDPLRLFGAQVPGPYQAHTGSWCNNGDPICQLGGLHPLAHIAYGDSITNAALFSARQL
ncbi:cutinase family protein [Nocardia sp. NPDC051030]|uniref:cutinase family protein n=1 Tax=Nocardia sp. NPDC051030 TaxID=3155162 RepID=UPI0034460320